MDVRWRLLVWSVLAVLCIGAAPVQAAPGFYSGGVFRPLFIATDSVVVRLANAPTRARAAANGFARLGAVVVLRNAVKPHDQILGYPVSFDAAGRAVAVLTHEIVVRGDHARVALRIRRTAGFAALTKLPFGRHLYLAQYKSPMAALAAANA